MSWLTTDDTMHSKTNHLSRRNFVKLAGITAAGCSLVSIGNAEGGHGQSLFSTAKTLDGWLQIENSATSLSVGQIKDQATFVGALLRGPDAVVCISTRTT